MKKNNLAIKLTNLSKTYQLHHEKPTLAENIFRRNKKETFTALKEINLEIKKGEKIGIIGSNGSGKTTLLKIISGISTQTKGSVKTFGKLVSLIDLSAGFHPELTGQENIFLSGLIIGMSKNEIREKFQDIINFADIGSFIDAPLYTYSTGMQLRLGFSIAVHSDPDILILDEGMMTGDENFQKKSGEKIEEFFRAKKTILVATHSMDFLEDHCQKIIWLNKGKINKTGGLEIIDEYKKMSKSENNPLLVSVGTRTPSDPMYYTTIKNLKDSVEFQPIVLDNYPGNLERFFNLPNDLPLDRMIIFTDTSDVIFQSPIPVLDKTKIYISPEFNIWGNNDWWLGNFGKLFPKVFSVLKDNQVINAGVFAMTGRKLMELVEFMRKNKKMLNEKPWADQPLFNLWLKKQKEEDIVHDDRLAVCLYEGWSRKLTTLRNGYFVNKQKEIISIVHGNGTQKETLNKSRFLKENKWRPSYWLHKFLH